MFKHIKYNTILIFSFLNSMICFAQESNVDMADGMRENGKIYVVVAVLCIVFAGIVSYLIVLDRKLTKFEKQKEL